MNQPTIKIKEQNNGILGKVTIHRYKAGTVDQVRELINLAKKNASKPDIAKIYLEKVQQIFKENEIGNPIEQKNLVMQSANYGKDIIIQRLVGINTYSLNITYIEIGTGSTTPTINDVALTTPILRAPLSFSQDYANQQAQVQFYITDANLANGTYYEIGTFVDGSASIGSGQLFNHALLNTPYVKSSGQDTTIEVDFTIN